MQLLVGWGIYCGTDVSVSLPTPTFSVSQVDMERAAKGSGARVVDWAFSEIVLWWKLEDQAKQTG